MLRWLHQCFSALVFIPLYIALSLLMLPGCLLLCLFSQRLASRYIASPWARLGFYLLPAKLDLSGSDNFDGSQSYVVVVNHTSQYDILALYGWLDLDLKWVMKKELRHVPIIGWACSAMGHIFLDRSNSEAAVKQLKNLKKTLQPGVSVLFFPEGTRSHSGELLPFKKGAFVMAKNLELPVLPVTINGTQSILPIGGYIPAFGRATMHVHPPISVEDVATMSLVELKDRARDVIDSERLGSR
ncbi:1-acyl-sn-glycerol-3-phosphate acyltransferase [Sinobacterium norvegicum]|uniref:1-acyl-sn-glycerol-3-phosphate acyltransferase n=1 Tax=Sinobacterium norvegicum TaxID=1641715 RepID=A0ABM9A9Y7_9GAMM|nr:lysophospholipid acyltransferase family protein [Sinobacterium norvegicum]CAH0989938.1 1-acyl-sn-glycerol-3-phosphate acyltransferase [Sinobacterium norvegicum]